MHDGNLMQWAEKGDCSPERVENRKFVRGRMRLIVIGSRIIDDDVVGAGCERIRLVLVKKMYSFKTNISIFYIIGNVV